MLESQSLLFDIWDDDDMSAALCPRCMRPCYRNRNGSIMTYSGASLGFPERVCSRCNQEGKDRQTKLAALRSTINLDRIRANLSLEITPKVRQPESDLACCLCGREDGPCFPGTETPARYEVSQYGCEGRACAGCRDELADEAATKRYHKCLSRPVFTGSAGWSSRNTPRVPKQPKPPKPSRCRPILATSTQPPSNREAVASILANEGRTIRRVTRSARGYATQQAAARAEAEAASLAAHSQEADRPVELAEAV